jgi:hypothetical protein
MAEQWGYQLAEQRKRLGLTAAESARVLFFRRELAVNWLHIVHKRPGPVAGQQAERVLSLLGS